MAESSSSFSELVHSMMSGASVAITSKTVMGEPVVIGDTTLIPLSDVSIGCGAGASYDPKKNSSGGGFGAKISPTAVLIVRDGTCKVVNIKTQDAVTKFVDMVPDFMDKILAVKGKGEMMGADDAIETVFPNRKKK